MSAAIHLSGPTLIIGALAFGLMVALIAREPAVGMTMTPGVAALAISSTALLLVSLPAAFALQAAGAGVLGLVGHALLSIGLLLVVVVAAGPILHPSVSAPTGEHPLLFALGIALVLGLVLTSIATLQASVFPRPAAFLLLGATIGFFFVFFVAEFLPPAAGQIGSALFGVLLATALSWMGITLWQHA